MQTRTSSVNIDIGRKRIALVKLETIKEMVVDRCNLPNDFDVNDYELFQGIPTKVLTDNDVISIGGRQDEVLHTPGHAPRHLCFWETEYYDIANDVLNASRKKYAHLFNTKLLMKKQITSEEDSVVRFIEVKNPMAKKYFGYQLGRFHAPKSLSSTPVLYMTA